MRCSRVNCRTGEKTGAMADSPLVVRFPDGAVPHVPLGTLPTSVSPSGVCSRASKRPSVESASSGSSSNRWTIDRLRRRTVESVDAYGVDLPSDPRGQLDVCGRNFGGSDGDPSGRWAGSGARSRTRSAPRSHRYRESVRRSPRRVRPAGSRGQDVVYWQPLNTVDLTEMLEVTPAAQLLAGYRQYLAEE